MAGVKLGKLFLDVPVGKTLTLFLVVGMSGALILRDLSIHVTKYYPHLWNVQSSPKVSKTGRGSIGYRHQERSRHTEETAPLGRGPDGR